MEVAFAAPPPNIRVPAQRAQAGAWRVDKHPIKRAQEWRPMTQVRLDDSNVRSAAGGHCATEEIQSRLPKVACDDQALAVHRRRKCCRLPARGGTRIEDTLPWMGSGQL